MSSETDTEGQEPTIADLAAIAGMLPELQAIETRPVEWSGGERGADGSIQMPYATYAPAAERLMRAIYEHKLIVEFDWPSWQEEGQRFLDPEVASTASVEDIRRLLTLHVRQERFVEGHFATMIANGHIILLLKRLGALLAEHSA